MTETEFIALAQKTFDDLEACIEALGEDLDIERQGNVLTIETEDGFQIVINQQTPMKQIWLASLKGGYRFDWMDAHWVEAAKSQTIEDVLSGLLTQKLGHKVELLQGWNQTLEDLITDGSADRINFFWRCGFAQT